MQAQGSQVKHNKEGIQTMASLKNVDFSLSLSLDCKMDTTLLPYLTVSASINPFMFVKHLDNMVKVAK